MAACVVLQIQKRMYGRFTAINERNQFTGSTMGYRVNLSKRMRIEHERTNERTCYRTNERTCYRTNEGKRSK